MKNTDNIYDGELTTEDAKIIFLQLPIKVLLQPMKMRQKYYKDNYRREMTLIARCSMSEKSATIKKFLPEIASKIYGKGDPEYVKLARSNAYFFRNMFYDTFEEITGKNLTGENFSAMTLEEIKTLMKKFLQDPDSKTLDLELIYLQIKLCGVKINSEQHDMIRQAWQYVKEYDELLNQFKDKVHQKEKEIEHRHGKEIQQIKAEYVDQIQKLNNIIDTLNSQVGKKEHIEAELNHEIEMLNEQIRSLENAKKNSEAVYENTLQLLENEKKHSEQLSEQLTEIKANKLAQYQEELRSESSALNWQNEQIKEQKVALEGGIKILQNKKSELQKEIISSEQAIKEYFINIDKHILEQKIESLIFPYVHTLSEQYNISKGTSLFIKEGHIYKSSGNFESIEDFVDAAEDNLTRVGYRRSEKIICAVYSSIKAGIYPLICGFGSRKICYSIISAMYGEIPETIAIPSGYSEIRELIDSINKAETKVVLIEDLFGKLNEDIILPILREFPIGDKILIFTCEDIECLQYVKRYFYNYFMLVKIGKCKNIETTFNYGNVENIKNKYEHRRTSGREYQIARTIFYKTGVNHIYSSRWADILAYLIYEFEIEEAEAIEILMQLESRWILSTEEIENVKDNILKLGYEIHLE